MGTYSINKTDQAGQVTGTMDLEVRVSPIKEPMGNKKAFASVTIDGMFGIHGISVVEGKNGLFASMPQTKDRAGEYRDIAHPVTKEGRMALNDAVVSEYKAEIGALEAKLESTTEKIREAKSEAKEAASKAPAKAAEKRASRGAKNKTDDSR